MAEGNVHHIWGASPALDLNEVLAAHASLDDEAQELHFLLVHPGDVRHVLKTLAQRGRYPNPSLDPNPSPNPNLHFHIMESAMEVQARNLGLLSILLDFELPIRQRASLFLEVFGNAFVQSRTSRMLAELGLSLERLLCDGDGFLRDFFDFSGLKFKDRDAMQAAFQAWGEDSSCDMETFLDRRRRYFFKERYDARRNMCDWAYVERVKPANDVIHHHQYRDWRLKGLAFEFGDCEYTRPNRTMATYTQGIMKKGRDRGLKKELKGYWSDILNSPYLSFGVDADAAGDERAEALFDVFNKNSGAPSPNP